ncbi:uncharacterized protein LOC126847148 isoform X3 [Adelges cooleyi]|uniref:uncharacterized protein LOC126847148 isoform X3 n=1 Tax=Adelges cooleyi TaxID=133065 RepID=UPI0021803987|nr:uncharacterized protein LOC126847148 isoform X3 [Adelges cooleyi]
MEKFSGHWYAIKTTLPYTRCVGYDFYTQKLENVQDYKAKSKYECIMGELEANPRLPSQMTYTDLNIDYSKVDAMKPAFVVFATDYDSYAGVYFCSKEPRGFRHYVSILSRSEDIDEEILNELMVSIVEGHSLPDDLKLKPVDHKDCVYENIEVNSNDQNAINDDGKTFLIIKFLVDDEPTP